MCPKSPNKINVIQYFIKKNHLTSILVPYKIAIEITEWRGVIAQSVFHLSVNSYLQINEILNDKSVKVIKNIHKWNLRIRLHHLAFWSNWFIRVQSHKRTDCCFMHEFIALCTYSNIRKFIQWSHRYLFILSSCWDCVEIWIKNELTIECQETKSKREYYMVAKF